jgi:hypothetical protein
MTVKPDGEPEINVALTIDAPPELLAQRGCDAERASELDETGEVLRVELPTDQQMAPPLNPGKEAFDTSQLLRAFPGHNT